jgi:hypothetical protein
MLNDREKRILAMWEKNMTGGEIGNAIGITRNAVMGILGRLRARGHVGYKVPPPAYRKRVRKGVEPQKTSEPPKPSTKTKPKPAANPDQFEMVVLKDLSLPPHGPVTLMKLHRLSCRYIISEVKGSETLFCGKMKTTGAYCAEHHELCYVPSMPRKKRVVPLYRG